MAHILIVDDDANLRASLRSILEDEGHEVEEEVDGARALRRFAGHPSDLVITDVYMPEMNGIEFAMRVQEAFPEAKIIGMSGGGFLPGASVLEALQALGAVGKLEKPLDADEVIRVVKSALGETTASEA